MGSRGPTPMRAWAGPPPPPLPPAVGWELAHIETLLGQLADPKARQQLADVGEAAALRVLRMIGESRTPVGNFSAYIMWTAREAPDAESAACSSGPSRGDDDDSVQGPMHDDDIQMQDDVINSATAFNVSNHAMIDGGSSARQLHYGSHTHGKSPAGAAACFAPNTVGMEVEENPPGWMNSVPMAVDSHLPEMAHVMPNQGGTEGFAEHHLSFRMQDQEQPLQPGSPFQPVAHWVPNHTVMQAGSPDRGLVPGLQNQVGFNSPVRQTIPTSARFDSPVRQITTPSERMDSTPIPVRDITRRVQQMGCLSGTVRAEKTTTTEYLMPVEPLGTANTLWATASPQMLALGELEFVRIFLIYVYLAGKKIEDVGVLHEDYIRFLNTLPMDRFESEIWNRFGHQFIAESDRRKNLDWDPSKTRVYHCNIEERDYSTVTIFKGPYIEKTTTRLHKVVGDDNVLVVKFSDISGHTNASDYLGTCRAAYNHIFEDGIMLGLRRYRFFIFKDGGKAEKRKEESKREKNKKYTSSVRCYFVRTESGWDRGVPYILSNRRIGDARKLFMHIHTVPSVAKYLARFALILSKTITVLDAEDLSTVDIVTIDDVPCKDENGDIVLKHGEVLIHTDGTGLISEDLAKRCPASVFKGNLSRTNDMQDAVYLKEDMFDIDEHIRMFYNGLAVKGTLLVVRTLPSRTIHIRPSMIKVNPDPSLLGGGSLNSLELVSTSNRPKRALTSRFLITLLHYGGVPVEYFMDLLGKALKDVEKARHETRHSLEVAFNHADMDDSMSARMILAGIRPEDDAYLQHQLTLMTKQERKGLKQGRIPIDQCYNLMSTTDPTGTLKPHEVCVILDHGPISGEVLVYKHPGLHFGDIHVLNATFSEDIQDDVGDYKYAILFPISGPRSLADEMANADHDGDMFWVSRNPQLLKYFKPSEPWDPRNPPRKTEQEMAQGLDGSTLERVLARAFFRTRFTPSYALGTASDSWLVYMDRLLTCEVEENKKEKELIKAKMLELVDIYYDALDAPKTGNKINIPGDLKAKVYPHFMERKRFPLYHSTSVLGKIYDEAESQQSESVHPIKISPLTCFTEEEATNERNIWGPRYQEYLKLSSSLCNPNHAISKEEKNMRFQELFKTYKQMLYGAAEPEQSQKNRSVVFSEACAIYQLVYENAVRWNDVRKCGFAWKVAGDALLDCYITKRGEKTVRANPQVLRDAFRRDHGA